MNKTLRCLISLSLTPVVIPFVLLLHLSRTQETRALCAEFWAAFVEDIRQVFGDREFWADVVTFGFIAINGAFSVAGFLGGHPVLASVNLATAMWLAMR